MSRIRVRIFVWTALVGCINPRVFATPADQEMVLTEGVTLSVHPLPHKQVLYPEGGDIPFAGSLEIRAGVGYRRDYTWDGERRSVDLEPREERWLGSLG